MICAFMRRLSNIPNNSKKHAAGAVFLGAADGINYAPKATALANKTANHTMIVYRAVGARADRVLVVWGLY